MYMIPYGYPLVWLVVLLCATVLILTLSIGPLVLYLLQLYTLTLL